MTNVVDMGIQQSDMQQKIIRIEAQQEANDKKYDQRFRSIESKVDKLEGKFDKMLDILIELKSAKNCS